jgi:acetyl esterase/lipase
MLRHVLPLTVLAATAFAQTAADFAQHLSNDYRVTPNVTYLSVGGVDLKLDVYRRNATGPQPTLVYMHGGFWVAGNKEGQIMSLMPWMEMGWNVINVEYRLGGVALAPAALEDCLCALRFIGAQAQLTAYNIDPTKIVVMGESAGGHLALALGMIPDSAGLDGECTDGRTPLPKVAAVVNWFGVYDVPDVIDGPNKQGAAMRWFGSLPNKMEIAKRVSPMTYVRAGLPPMITIHGDKDTTVPYPQAQRLKADLDRLGVPNQLVSIPGKGHGGFNAEERTMIYREIRAFLAKNGVTK